MTPCPDDTLPAIAHNERRLGSKAPTTSEVFVRRAGNLATPRHRGDDRQKILVARLDSLPKQAPKGYDELRSHRSPYQTRLIGPSGAISSRSVRRIKSLPDKLRGGNPPFTRASSLQPLGPEEVVDVSARSRVRQVVGRRSEERAMAPVLRVPDSCARDNRGGLCNSGRGWDQSEANYALVWAHMVGLARSASEAGDCLAGAEESSAWDRHAPLPPPLTPP